MSNEQQEQQGPSRRSFFKKLAAGTIGGFSLASLLPNALRAVERGEKKDVTVRINPLAIPRTNKSVKSHGE